MAREQQSISLLPIHVDALAWLQRQRPGATKAQIVRDLLEREMKQEFGRDWPVEVRKALEQEAA